MPCLLNDHRRRVRRFSGHSKERHGAVIRIVNSHPTLQRPPNGFQQQIQLPSHRLDASQAVQHRQMEGSILVGVGNRCASHERPKVFFGKGEVRHVRFDLVHWIEFSYLHFIGTDVHGPRWIIGGFFARACQGGRPVLLPLLRLRRHQLRKPGPCRIKRFHHERFVTLAPDPTSIALIKCSKPEQWSILIGIVGAVEFHYRVIF
mmetsp:Transcript_34668/g.73858  ORF Transcript_34668/g.73858 Transcript_34668/m.73858 type:complete len:204 (-) Transcript_34668:72-683(-)